LTAFHRRLLPLCLGALTTSALASTPPPSDKDTTAWWAIATALSGDEMEGRDAGSPGHEKAAQIVAAKFKAAGLKPAGEAGGWFQTVALNEIAVSKASFSAGDRSLAFLHDVGVQVTAALPASIDAPMVYAGYCGADALGDVKGKLVICHATRRTGLPSADQRTAAVKAAGGIGIISIPDPGFTIEPPRWPEAAARIMTLAETTPPSDPFLGLRIRAEALGSLLGPSHPETANLVARGSRGEPLPRFDLPDRLTATLTVTKRSLTSKNILALLPGTDPALTDQVMVLSAHIDGYGHGTAVDGDHIYNGTLDDAAYVALLIRLAERRAGKGFRHPVLFAAFTAEEKGLLGARHYVKHPTIPLARTAGVINLDQLRPIFPLELLTVHALDDTTLGDDARAVATSLGIAVQNDPEPERNLLRRTDHWPFMEAGIPATNFVFGYKPGTESERIYRQWYRTGYHKPQDDVNQLMDWKAAADFNRFFYTLVERVADKPEAPRWKPGSALRPK